MQVGAVIRKYRKEKSLTQSEMAKRLGVSAPAVNKWENGNSLPDISLLSPIARLLGISVDTLISHEEDLSKDEVGRLVVEAHEKLKTEGFDSVFLWMKRCLAEYPNDYQLILWMARLFDGERIMRGLSDEEHYERYILDCYKRVVESDDERLRSEAAEALYNFFFRKEEYGQAEEYLDYLSPENPERKRKQALIYSKTDRQEDAYRMYEELLYTGYQSLSMTFQALYILTMQESDLEKAHMMVDKMGELARLFEVGEYHEVSQGLELAMLEKDEAATLRIVECMLTNLESMVAFTRSPLYAHMEFSEPNETYLAEVRESLLTGFREEEAYAYLMKNQRWRDLVGLPIEPE